jgi:hydrogenase-4 component E
MDPVQAPGVYQGVANVIAAVMLLIEFGMLRQALGRDQVRLYMAQSALLSVLAVVIAADRNLPDLYALAALSAALKVVAVPLVMRRVLGWTGGEGRDEEEPVGVAGSHTLSPASAVLAGIVLAAVGFFCFGAMQIHGPAAPATALSIAGAMVLVAFGPDGRHGRDRRLGRHRGRGVPWRVVPVVMVMTWGCLRRLPRGVAYTASRPR